MYLYLYCAGIGEALLTRRLYGGRLLNRLFSKDRSPAPSSGGHTSPDNAVRNILLYRVPLVAVLVPAVVFNGCRHKDLYTVASEM